MSIELTTTGLLIETLDEIKRAIEADIRGYYGQEIDLTPESVFGQWVGILSEREASVQQQIRAVYDSADPKSATGQSLDNIGALTATPRLAAERTTGIGLLKGTDTTTVPAGSQVKLNSTEEIYQTTAAATIGFSGTPGEEPVEFEAVETGPKIALATGPSGWTLETPVSGWDTFETAEDATPGSDVETDEAYRIRRIQRLNSGGSATVAAIEAAVLGVSQVVAVRVFENRSLVTDAFGVPGKAFETMIDDTGADDQEVVDAIGAAKPAGIATHGSIELDYTTASGEAIPTRFSRVAEIDLYVRATITTTGAEDPFPADGEIAVRDALLAYGEQNHVIGTDVVASRFIGPAHAAAGGIDNVAIELSDNGSTWVSSKIVINARGRAAFDSTRITVIRI